MFFGLNCSTQSDLDSSLGCLTSVGAFGTLIIYVEFQ
jgi:hypothetical protein